MSLKEILYKESFSKYDIINLLKSDFENRNILYQYASEIKDKYVNRITYFRGLIEHSNICSKNCFYCGIRHSNSNVLRYSLSDEEILEAAKFAYQNDYGSIVLQGGEIESESHTQRINTLIQRIMDMSNGTMGITLSLGEQSYATYELWKNSGAKRYLLRIETSNEDLYYKIHPKNKHHSFERRKECLKKLRKLGYQVGTGIMIGLPWQTHEHIADDAIFMRDIDIDMCGMGPYIEHKDTPLYEYRHLLLPLKDRFDLTLKLIAIMRIMMKDINIAASTAMQAIDKYGREKAIKAGANIIMPNITPGIFRDHYKLYENKPCTDEEAKDCLNCMEARITIAGDVVGLKEQGDSLHYFKKIEK